jgi:hypothetical protein
MKTNHTTFRVRLFYVKYLFAQYLLLLFVHQGNNVRLCLPEGGFVTRGTAEGDNFPE